MPSQQIASQFTHALPSFAHLLHCFLLSFLVLLCRSYFFLFQSLIHFCYYFDHFGSDSSECARARAAHRRISFPFKLFFLFFSFLSFVQICGGERYAAHQRSTTWKFHFVERFLVLFFIVKKMEGKYRIAAGGIAWMPHTLESADENEKKRTAGRDQKFDVQQICIHVLGLVLVSYQLQLSFSLFISIFVRFVHVVVEYVIKIAFEKWRITFSIFSECQEYTPI